MKAKQLQEKGLKPGRSQARTSVFIVICLSLAGLMASIASGIIPEAIKGYLGLSWIFLAFFLGTAAYLTLKQWFHNPVPPQEYDLDTKALSKSCPSRSWAYIHSPRASVLADAVLMSSVDILAAKMDTHTSQKLQELRELWVEGKQEPVLNWLSETKADKLGWNLLANATRAAILRFEAVTKLNSPRNIDEAIRLADEAHQIAPEEDESKIRVMILRHQGRHLEALALLEGKDDIDATNLKAGLLMQLGRQDEALAMLSALLKDE